MWRNLRFICILWLFSHSLSSFGQTDTSLLKPVVAIAKVSRIGLEEGYSIDQEILKGNITEPLSKVLQQGSALFVRDYGRGQEATVTFRGMTPSHTQVEWNGIVINNSSTGVADVSLVPTLFFDNAEVAYGESTLENNQTALGGSIHLSNKISFGEKELVGLVTAGSFSTYKQCLKGDWSNDKWYFSAGGFHESSLNNYPFENYQIKGSPIQELENADYRRWGVIASLARQIDEDNSLEFSYWGQENDQATPTKLSLVEGAEDRIRNDLQSFTNRAVLSWNHDKKGYDILGRSSVNQEKTDFFFAISETVRPEESNTNGLLWQNTLSVEWNTGEKMDWEVAGIANYQKINSLSYRYGNYDTSYNERRWETSTFLKNSWEIVPSVTVRSIIRGEFVPNFPSLLLGSIAVSWKILGDDLMLYANGYRNGKIPSITDLYSVPGGNLELLPELSFGGDLGGSWHWQKKSWGVQLSSSFFSQKVDNWILWTPTAQGIWSPENIATVKAYGSENRVELTYYLPKISFSLASSYTYTQSLNIANSPATQLPYIPEHTANIFSSAIWKNWTLTYSFVFTGEMYTTTNNLSSAPTMIYEAYVSNLQLLKEIPFKNDKQINCQLRINNLLNSRYYSMLLVPMPGINFEFALGLKL